jgi:hypothetical protein
MSYPICDAGFRVATFIDFFAAYRTVSPRKAALNIASESQALVADVRLNSPGVSGNTGNVDSCDSGNGDTPAIHSHELLNISDGTTSNSYRK